MSINTLTKKEKASFKRAERLRELFRTFDHLTRKAFRDILTTPDYSRRVGKSK